MENEINSFLKNSQAGKAICPYFPFQFRRVAQFIKKR